VAYVPAEVKFQTRWQIADELVAYAGPNVPHAWIVGDDEFGRPSEFRDRLAVDGGLDPSPTDGRRRGGGELAGAGVSV
jgi:hypothetical protein